MHANGGFSPHLHLATFTAKIRKCPRSYVCSTGVSTSFYSDEGQEPPHINVKTPDGECKFWLSPVRLARVGDVKPNEVRRIEISVIDHEALFLEKWHEHSQS